MEKVLRLPLSIDESKVLELHTTSPFGEKYFGLQIKQFKNQQDDNLEQLAGVTLKRQELYSIIDMCNHLLGITKNKCKERIRDLEDPPINIWD